MARIKAFVQRHPNITMWIALAIGMVIILLLAAPRDILLPHQMAALVASTILLAGLCAWIISWD